MLQIDVTKTKTVKWPIAAKEPSDGGKFLPRSFVAHFEILDNEEFEEIIQGPAKEADEKTVRRALKDWSGVKDADGTDLELNEEVLNWIFSNAIWLRNAIAKGYLEAHYGGGKGKN